LTPVAGTRKGRNWQLASLQPGEMPVDALSVRAKGPQLAIRAHPLWADAVDAPGTPKGPVE